MQDADDVDSTLFSLIEHYMSPDLKPHQVCQD